MSNLQDYLGISQQQSQTPPDPTLGVNAIPQSSSGTPTPATSPAETYLGASGAGLTPSAVVGVARTSQSAYDAAVKAQYAKIYSAATGYADSLRSTPAQFQSQMWSKASSAMRSLLQQAGYQPPSAPWEQSSPGWWHAITRMADVAGHAVKGAIGKTVQTLASPFTWAGSLATQAQRDLTYTGKQAELSNLESGGSGNTVGTFLNALNPATLVHNWNAVRYGGSTFDPIAVTYVQRQMGVTGDAYHLAAAMASGQTLTQVLNSVPSAQRANAYGLIQSTPKFQAAVQLLGDSHVSFGQSFAGALSPTQTHALFPQVSVNSQKAFDTAAQGTAILGTVALAATGNEEGAGGMIASAGRTVGGLAKMTGAALQATAVTQGLLKNQTPDQAYQIHPFGMTINPASGVADGLVQWYMNPLFVGATARTAYKIGQAHAIMDMMGSVENMRSVYANIPKYQRAGQKFVEAVTKPWVKLAPDGSQIIVNNEPNFQELAAQGFPVDTGNAKTVISVPDPANPGEMKNVELTGGMDQAIKDHFAQLKAAAETGDPQQMAQEFATMISGDHAMIQMMRGTWARYFRNATIFPNVSFTQAALDEIRGVGRAAWGGKRINLVKLTPMRYINALTSEVAQEDLNAIKSQIRDASANPPDNFAARFLRRAVNLTPSGAMDFSKPGESAVQMERALSYGLPQNQIDMYLNTFRNLPAAAIGSRRSLYQAAMKEMLAAAIDHENKQSLQWLDNFFAREHYGAAGAGYIDPYNPEGELVNHALDPTQLSNMAAIPNFADVARFGKQNWAAHILHSTVGSDWFEKNLMRVWKQALLFRPGFALRFAGEEMANFMLRHGPEAWARARIASSITDALNSNKELVEQARAVRQAALEGNPNAVNRWDAGRVWDAVTGHIPHPLRDSIQTGEELRAQTFFWHTMQFLRRQQLNIARSISGDDMMRIFKDLAERGVLGNENFADHVDVNLGHANGYFGDVPHAKDWHNLIRDANGLPMSLHSEHGFKIYAREDQEALPAYRLALSGVADGPVFSRAARAFRDGLGPEGQIQAVKDWILHTYSRDQLAQANTEIARIEGLDNFDAFGSRIKEIDKRVTSIKREIAQGGDEDGMLREKLDALMAEASRLGKKHDGLPQQYLDALTAKSTAEETLAKHEKLLKQFSTWGQTQDGRLREFGATDDEIAYDWARNAIQHVNELTMTPESYMVPPEDAGRDWQAPDQGLMKPIQLSPHVEDGMVREIATRDVGRQIKLTDEQSPYANIPDGHVRLFHPLTPKYVTDEMVTPNPGRYWTPNFQRASNYAGEHGQIVHADVPHDALLAHYDYRGSRPIGDFLHEVQSAQHANGADTLLGTGSAGYFESGQLRGAANRTPRTLIGELAEGRVPTHDELAALDRKFWPDKFVAPDTMLSLNGKGGYLQRLMDWGFYHSVGRPANWLSRQPIWGYNYYLARMEAERYLSRMGLPDPSGDLAHDIASDRATHETMPYVHDPRARSQFQTVVRGLMPFWFAQEQFYKRWGRLLTTYPEAFYKLSQTMNGLRNVGFVYKDQYGQDAFVYPGSQAVIDLIQRVFGTHLPVSAGFEAEIAQLNPSLSNGLAPIPSFSPVVTVPLAVAGHMFPQVSKFGQFFQGPDAPVINSRDWVTTIIDGIVPALASRMTQWGQTEAMGSANSTAGPALYLTSMIQAAQQLEATGHGLPASDQNDAAKVSHYLDRLSNWSKNLMLIRALFGFFAPATPNYQIANNALGNQLQALLSSTGKNFTFDEAITAFVKAHPNATPYTVFESTTGLKGMSGAYVPATQAAADFINAHLGLFQNYSAAAPWLIDAPSANALFSQPAYDLEKSLDLRVHQSLSSWYTQVKYMEGANIYYPLETMVHAAEGQSAALQQLGISQQEAIQKVWSDPLMTKSGIPDTTPISQAWSEWKDGFMRSHPIFAGEYQSKGADSAMRRMNVVNEMQSVIDKGALPSNPTSEAIAGLMMPWQQFYQGIQKSLATSPHDASWRDQAKASYVAFGNAYVAAHPLASAYWTGVLMKTIEAF